MSAHGLQQRLHVPTPAHESQGSTGAHAVATPLIPQRWLLNTVRPSASRPQRRINGHVWRHCMFVFAPEINEPRASHFLLLDDDDVCGLAFC
jgi:hypothetical protein